MLPYGIAKPQSSWFYKLNWVSQNIFFSITKKYFFWLIPLRRTDRILKISWYEVFAKGFKSRCHSKKWTPYQYIVDKTENWSMNLSHLVNIKIQFFILIYWQNIKVTVWCIETSYEIVPIWGKITLKVILITLSENHTLSFYFSAVLQRPRDNPDIRNPFNKQGYGLIILILLKYTWLIQKIMFQSSHNFAHAMTAKLSWHVHNCDLMGSLE